LEVIHRGNRYDVRFQVLKAAGMKMTAFWDIVPWSLVKVN
jgi:hypothetical protein